MTPEGTVLVVDDNRRNIDLCQINLEEEGYDVVTAANGREALTQAEKHTPHLILLDIMMPVMDGFEALKYIRIHPQLKEIPVIMLTAKASVDNVVQALELGANDYLKKPFEVEEMLARVRNMVNLKKSQNIIREQNQRLIEEMKLARILQENLLPGADSISELARMGLAVHAFTSAASEVNGDFYFIRALDRENVCICLVDCMGHGVPAGMMTMAVQSLIQSVTPILPSAAEPLNYLDRLLYGITRGKEFAAITYLFAMPASGRFIMAQGGMPQALYYRKKSKTVTEVLTEPGPPLGLSRTRVEYMEVEDELALGDKLICFTDGLTEAINNEGLLFGIPLDNMKEMITQWGDLSADQLGQKLIDSWKTFYGGSQQDDCSLVIIEKI